MGVTTTTFWPLPPFSALREARRQHADYEIEDAELHAAEQADARAGFEALVAAGIGQVAIGSSAAEWLCRWAVPATPGLEVSGPVRPWRERWQERPVVTAKPEAGSSWLAPFREQADGAGAPALRAILPGAHYWMDVAFDEHFASRAESCAAFTERVAAEVRALVAEGVTRLQIDELALGHRPEERDHARAAVEAIVEAAGEASVVLGLGAPAADVLAAVADWPVAGFALDVSADGLEPEALADLPGEKTVLAGVGGEHGDAASIGARVEQLRGALGDERLTLAAGSGFEYLPSDEAERRLKLLIEAAG